MVPRGLPHHHHRRVGGQGGPRGSKIESPRKWSIMLLLHLPGPYSDYTSSLMVLLPWGALWATFRKSGFGPPLTPHATMVVVGKASGHHGPDLQHGSYGHILPQAPHWGPTRQHYNTGWPQGGVACPPVGCTPRPPSWARTTRPRWHPQLGLPEAGATR